MYGKEWLNILPYIRLSYNLIFILRVCIKWFNFSILKGTCPLKSWVFLLRPSLRRSNWLCIISTCYFFTISLESFSDNFFFPVSKGISRIKCSSSKQLPYLDLFLAPSRSFLYAAVNWTVVGFVFAPKLDRSTLNKFSIGSWLSL